MRVDPIKKDKQGEPVVERLTKTAALILAFVSVFFFFFKIVFF